MLNKKGRAEDREEKWSVLNVIFVIIIDTAQMNHKWYAKHLTYNSEIPILKKVIIVNLTNM